MLNITNHRETQIKTTRSYHLTPVRMTIIKRLQITNVDKDVEKREPSYAVGGNVNWCSHCGKQYGGSSKNKKLGTSLVAQWLRIHLPMQETEVRIPGLGGSHMLWSN